MRALISSSDDLECRWSVPNLLLASQLARQQPVRAVLVDKAFGQSQLIDFIGELRSFVPQLGVVVWGNSMNESEVLRLLQSGARGILRKSADLDTILACIRAVGLGTIWMEDCVFRESSRLDRQPHSGLTGREQQVLQLVEQGRKNKEIAAELGIRPGTVKIHLKHIFEKTGVHGRYGLALNGMRQRGLLSARPIEATHSA
ncbi:MAG: response regulator transcription factor [Candidatus Solibacter usitatus]|nr:response regulator transcription factor [Candidatus Solibacter usitatus]